MFSFASLRSSVYVAAVLISHSYFCFSTYCSCTRIIKSIGLIKKKIIIFGGSASALQSKPPQPLHDMINYKPDWTSPAWRGMFRDMHLLGEHTKLVSISLLSFVVCIILVTSVTIIVMPTQLILVKRMEQSRLTQLPSDICRFHGICQTQEQSLCQSWRWFRGDIEFRLVYSCNPLY